MKRSKRGCVGCEAKARGATSWQIGYIVGAHHSEVIADDTDDEPREPKLCALHLRLAGKAFGISIMRTAERGRALITRDAAQPWSTPKSGTSTT